MERAQRRAETKTATMAEKNKTLAERNHKYQRENHSLKVSKKSLSNRVAGAFERARNMVTCITSSESRRVHLKDKNGVIPDNIRDAIGDLVSLCNVPAKRAVDALKRVAEACGVEVVGDIHRRSVGRITKELGVAAELQFGQAVLSDATKGQIAFPAISFSPTLCSTGITLSGDGTSHENETYECRHATVINDKNKPVQFFLGIMTAVNHTSQTQLDGQFLDVC